MRQGSRLAVVTVLVAIACGKSPVHVETGDASRDGSTGAGAEVLASDGRGFEIPLPGGPGGSSGATGSGTGGSTTVAPSDGGRAADAPGTGGGGGASQCKPGVACIVPEGCGDGINNQDGLEECDDGNALPGDGCSGVCHVERNWVCPIQGPCTRQVVCGDGVVGSGEICDDGNTVDGDGCGGDCTRCDANDADACRAPAGCGDGTIDPTEECDEGGTLNKGDYGSCAADCTYAPTAVREW